MANNLLPALGWTTAAQITRVIDGDTIDVTVTRKLRVRLLDCWAPEVRTRDLAEKERGLAAKAALEALVESHGATGVLFIPTGAGQELADVLSFGRVLGKMHLPEIGNLSQVMVGLGHAKKTKSGE